MSHRESAEKSADGEEEEEEEEEDLVCVEGVAVVSITRGASHSGQGIDESECSEPHPAPPLSTLPLPLLSLAPSEEENVTEPLPALLDRALLLLDEDDEE